VGGAFLDEMLDQCGACYGWAFGSATAVGVPPGYTLTWSALFENLFTEAVEPGTWGRVKAAYREGQER